MHEDHLVLQWFHQHAQASRLTGTAQRLWHYLYARMGIAHANRFYELSSRALANELEVSLKSVERSRKALQEAGFLRYEVRGKSVYYMLLLPEALLQSVLPATANEIEQHKKNIPPTETASGSFWWDRYQNTLDYELTEDDVDLLLQLMEEQLQSNALMIAQLEAQLMEQQLNACQDTMVSTNANMQNQAAHI